MQCPSSCDGASPDFLQVRAKCLICLNFVACHQIGQRKRGNAESSTCAADRSFPTKLSTDLVGSSKSPCGSCTCSAFLRHILGFVHAFGHADVIRPGVLSVAVETPRHSSVGGLLDYASEQTLPPGTLVRVPLGRREVPGIVWERAADAPPPPADLRSLTAALSTLPPLDTEWRELIAFAASYYQRGIGELALAVLPPDLRKLDDTRLARRLKRLVTAAAPGPTAAAPEPARPELNDRAGRRPGGHRDRPPARAAARCHRQRQDRGLPACGRRRPVAGPPGARAGARDQPHAAARDALRGPVSGTAHGQPAQWPDPGTAPAPLAAGSPGTRRPGAGHAAGGSSPRCRGWAHRHRRGARPVVQAAGRGALFGARPRGLARAPARDRRAAGLGHALAGNLAAGTGRALPAAAADRRIGGGAMPAVRLVDMARLPRETQHERVLAPPLLQAIGERIERGEQSLLLLNRRGYAPVLHCGACGWKSGCAQLQRLARLPQGRPHAGAAPTAASPSACRGPAPIAATSTSHPSGAAPRSCRSSSPRCCRARAWRGWTPITTRGAGALQSSSAPCTRARSTSWSARRCWPRGTISAASRWWPR